MLLHRQLTVNTIPKLTMNYMHTNKVLYAR